MNPLDVQWLQSWVGQLNRTVKELRYGPAPTRLPEEPANGWGETCWIGD